MITESAATFSVIFVLGGVLHTVLFRGLTFNLNLIISQITFGRF